MTTIKIDGPNGPQSVPLAPGKTSLGRTPDNTIPLAHEQVSRRHAEINQGASGCTITDLGSKNGTFVNGVRLAQYQPEPLKETDRIQIGPFSLSVEFAAPVGLAAPPATQVAVPPMPSAAPVPPPSDRPPTGVLNLQGRTVIKIGRAPDNDIVVNHPQASRYHAIVEQANNVYKISDLGSLNGTIVNGQRITGPRLLTDGDRIQIASYRFVLRAGQMQHYDDAGNIAIDALHLVRTVGKGVRILEDVSLAIQPREFVAIVGGSGAGKSTLLDALNGFRPATEGAVLYNGMDLYDNYDAFRTVIGYVPQDDIIHRELTVYGALDYAAQLRLPPDTTEQERHQRIEEVLHDLGLEQRRDTPIGKLSGGQRKRASIGVELLTKPSLFFLDEPTSGLDPSTETKMMRLLRELADQGRTIILVTHVTNNVKLCDKVVIMARGGRVAFYGKPDEALSFFQVRDFVDIYDRLETGKSEDWRYKFEQSPWFQQYVAQPLNAEVQAISAGRAARARPNSRRISPLAQLIILSRRNLEILMRDRASLFMMLLIAPMIGLLDFVTLSGDLFDLRKGSAAQIISGMFETGLICILVGGIAAMREIVKETEIYRRERMVGLGIAPYIFSKMWLGMLLALYQAFVLAVASVLAMPTMPHDPATFMQLYITLVVATISGMMIGLFVSAVSPNQNVAPLIMVMMLVPQFMFAGGMIPLNSLPGGQVIANVTSTKWAFDSLVTASAMGRAVARDKCWNLSTALNGNDFAQFKQDYQNKKFKDDAAALQYWQDSVLTEDYKKANCNCLGPNIFTRCKFPGILKEYTPERQMAVDAPEPQEPPAPGDPPPRPQDPPSRPPDPPARPECDLQRDPACGQEQIDWGNQMDDWRGQMTSWGNEMDRWREEFVAWGDSMDAYKVKTDRYQDAVKQWGEAKKQWQTNREKAIASGEGLVRKLYQDYGFTFDSDLTRNWLALGGITALFFVLVFGLQKYKDVAGR